MRAVLSFLLDENIPNAAIAALQKRGFIVHHIRKLGKSGIRNGEVYQLACELKSWIITRDSDFKSYLKFISYDVKGVIVFASQSELTRMEFVARLQTFFDEHESKLQEKLLIVIDEKEITFLHDE